MMKAFPRALFKIAVACSFSLMLRCAGVAQADANAQLPNLLVNGSFEKDTDGWDLDPKNGKVTATSDPKQPHGGRPSLRIDNLEITFSSFTQGVQLKPLTKYRLSGWIKASKIIAGDEKVQAGVGASLNINGIRERTPNVSDTPDWIHASVDFTTKADANTRVGLKLSDYGKAVKGTVWLAELSLVELGAGPVAATSKAPAASQLTAPVPPPAPALSATARASAAELVKTYRNSLVFVTGSNGSGSGFLAKNNSATFLFTNAHVAAGVKGASFKTLDDMPVKTAAAGCAVEHDVFSLQATPTAGKPFEIMQGVDQNAGIGDEIVVLGNAEGAGVINTITGRIVGIGPRLVEVDAPFQPGNSGSPIVHLKSGKVIGVATYAIIRKYDTTTQEPVKVPTIRRFGYRLDTIKIWQPVAWPAFSAQAAEIEAVEKLTDDLAGFLNDLATNSRVTAGAHNNPIIKKRLDAWLEDRAKRLSPRDAAMANQSFLSFLKITCQTDTAAARPHMTYDYFQRKLTDQQKERDEMSKVFDQIIQNVRVDK